MSLIVGIMSCFVFVILVVLFYKKYTDGMEEKIKGIGGMIASYDPQLRKTRKVVKYEELEKVINNSQYCFEGELCEMAVVVLEPHDDSVTKMFEVFEKEAVGYAEMHLRHYVSLEEDQKVVYFFTHSEEQLLEHLRKNYEIFKGAVGGDGV